MTIGRRDRPGERLRGVSCGPCPREPIRRRGRVGSVHGHGRDHDRGQVPATSWPRLLFRVMGGSGLGQTRMETAVVHSEPHEPAKTPGRTAAPLAVVGSTLTPGGTATATTTATATSTASAASSASAATSQTLRHARIDWNTCPDYSDDVLDWIGFPDNAWFKAAMNRADCGTARRPTGLRQTLRPVDQRRADETAGHRQGASPGQPRAQPRRSRWQWLPDAVPVRTAGSSDRGSEQAVRHDRLRSARSRLQQPPWRLRPRTAAALRRRSPRRRRGGRTPAGAV